MMNNKDRKLILSKLLKFYFQHGPNYFASVNETAGQLNVEKERLGSIVNQLIKEDLVLCTAQTEEQPAIAINHKKIPEIRIEISSWYTDVRFMISTIIGLAGWIVAIISLFGKK